MISIIILLLGGLTTAMITANGMLASLTGQIPAMVIIHTAGLIPTAVIWLLRPDTIQKKKAPFYLYLAGSFGVFITYTNAYCIYSLGASMTVSLMIAGQMMAALFVDTVGIPGWEKKPLTPGRVAGALTAMAGVFYMADNLQIQLLPILLAIISGVINQTNLILNAELASRIGIKKGTMMNFLIGLTVSLTLFIGMIVVKPGLPLLPLGSIPLPVLTGGLMGALLVFGLNSNLKKISVFKSAILLFIGQIVIGAISDLILFDLFKLKTMGGILLIFLSLYLNSIQSRKKAYSI